MYKWLETLQQLVAAVGSIYQDTTLSGEKAFAKYTDMRMSYYGQYSPTLCLKRTWNSVFCYTVRNTLREIELQNDYCNGCGLTDHGCGMTLLSNELQIRTIGSIPGITGHN